MIKELSSPQKEILPQKTFWFSNKTFWVALIFLISLFFRYQDFYQFGEFNSDKARQLHGAYNLLSGKGVSYVTYDLNTFQTQQIAMIDWPPGYTFLIAGICKLTSQDPYTASYILDFFSIALLWAALLWMTNLLKFSTLQVCILFVLLGISKVPWTHLYSADVIGAALFLLSCAFNIQYVQYQSRKQLFWISQFVLIGALCFLKYSLLPINIAIGFSVLAYSFRSKQKFFSTAAALFVFLVVFMGALYFYNKYAAGQSTALGERHGQHGSLFFGNLEMFNPFLLNGMLYLDSFKQKLSLSFFDSLVQIINHAIVLILLVKMGYAIYKKRAGYFEHLVFWTTLGICGFLSLMSVQYPKDIIGHSQWTYVGEMRYFAPAIFLLILYLIQNFKLKKVNSPFSFFVLFFVGFSTVYTVVLSSYYKVSDNTARSFENMYGNIVRANQFVKKWRNENTYFVSYTGRDELDTQVSSMVAIHGTKVAASYYNYFPDSTLAPLFSAEKILPKQKRIIVFLDKNLKVLDSLNPRLAYKLEENQQGEKFLVIN